MSDIPLKTRVYSVGLVLITFAVLWRASRYDSTNWKREEWLIAVILGVMIVLVEKWEIDFPHASFQFSISVGAILALAAGLTLQPLLGAMIVITAELISDIWERLKPIQVIVNAANL